MAQLSYKISQLNKSIYRKFMNKKDLSERDICSKYITPALQQSGWDLMDQVLEVGKL